MLQRLIPVLVLTAISAACGALGFIAFKVEVLWW
jgi:hypothetical protein